MTDEAFLNELWIYCYKTQIDGYPLGHPARTNFKPIVTTLGRPGMPLNREKILTLPAYNFSAEDRDLLLNQV